MSSRDSASDVLMAFLIGGATGAALALLFAPRSGEETRELISDAAREGARRARDVADRGREIGERAVDRGRKLVDDASQTVSRQADRVAEGVDKTARTMKEIRDR
jgi:gas vesicle protein